MTKDVFVSLYYPEAVKATKGTSLFPETLITKLALESGYQLSTLARLYNNFFGIKAIPAWTGKVVSMSTTENSATGSTRYTGTGLTYNSYNDAINKGANRETLFRVYPTISEGFKGYVSFLQANTRYAAVFTAKTPEAQFEALEKAGYAGADTTYSEKLQAVYNSLKAYMITTASEVSSNPQKKRLIIIAATALLMCLMLFIYLSEGKKAKNQ